MVNLNSKTKMSWWLPYKSEIKWELREVGGENLHFSLTLSPSSWIRSPRITLGASLSISRRVCISNIWVHLGCSLIHPSKSPFRRTCKTSIRWKIKNHRTRVGVKRHTVFKGTNFVSSNIILIFKFSILRFDGWCGPSNII